MATAAWALGEIGDKRAIPDLIVLLADQREGTALLGCDIAASHKISAVAAKALQKLGEGELAEVFRQVLERERDAEAIEQLRQWLPRYRSAIHEALIRALRNQHSDFVAAQAAWTLGELKIVESLPELKNLSRYSSKTVRQACREAVEKLEKIATLPRPTDATLVSKKTLPTAADPSAIPTETLPRTASPPTTE